MAEHEVPEEPSGMLHSDVVLPHDIDHSHPDISGGWLRAATFGAMDGLVSNTALIAGVAASASADTVVLSGVAGMLAGAFSMALGEYTSVTTANEQIDSEVRVERRAFKRYGDAEKVELVQTLMKVGLTEETARKATDEIHADEERAVRFHLTQELGVDPEDKPSPIVAAVSSFFLFAIGAVIPLLPYLLGVDLLWPGLICGGVGLLVAGGVAAKFTRGSVWFGAARQLIFGMAAIAATYLVGKLIGAVV